MKYLTTYIFKKLKNTGRKTNEFLASIGQNLQIQTTTIYFQCDF